MHPFIFHKQASHSSKSQASPPAMLPICQSSKSVHSPSPPRPCCCDPPIAPPCNSAGEHAAQGGQ